MEMEIVQILVINLLTSISPARPSSGRVLGAILDVKSRVANPWRRQAWASLICQHQLTSASLTLESFQRCVDQTAGQCGVVQHPLSIHIHPHLSIQTCQPASMCQDGRSRVSKHQASPRRGDKPRQPRPHHHVMSTPLVMRALRLAWLFALICYIPLSAVQPQPRH